MHCPLWPVRAPGRSAPPPHPPSPRCSTPCPWGRSRAACAPPPTTLAAPPPAMCPWEPPPWPSARPAAAGRRGGPPRSRAPCAPPHAGRGTAPARIRPVGVHAEEVHAVAHVDAVRVLQHEVVDGRLQRVLLEVGVGQVRHRPNTHRRRLAAHRKALVLGAELVVLGDALEVEQVVQPVLVHVQRVDLPRAHTPPARPPAARRRWQAHLFFERCARRGGGLVRNDRTTHKPTKRNLGGVIRRSQVLVLEYTPTGCTCTHRATCMLHVHAHVHVVDRRAIRTTRAPRLHRQMDSLSDSLSDR